MCDGDAFEVPTLHHLFGDAGELLVCHRSVGFVLQEQDFSVACMVASDAQKGHDCARRIVQDFPCDSLGVQRLVCNLDHFAPPLTGGINAASSPSFSGNVWS